MAVASLSRQRTVLSLTTRFCLPHEGMTQLEYLSRGSAFLLDGASTPGGAPSTKLSDLKILTCQHVACPWLFPNYFADKWDWLQHVSEEFVQHSLQLLEIPDESVDVKAKSYKPKVLVDIPLVQQVWLHPDRDVALLAVDEHDEARWQSLVAQWKLHALTLNPAACKPGDLLLFTGHKQLDSSDDMTNQLSDSEDASLSDASSVSEEEVDDEEPSVGQYPKEVYGRFVGKSARGQAFAWSQEILEEGMCGGTVVNEAGECVGLVEGIVPPYNPQANAAKLSPDATQEEREAAAAAAATARMQKALENHVAFVPSADIEEFLKDSADHMLLTGMALDL